MAFTCTAAVALRAPATPDVRSPLCSQFVQKAAPAQLGAFRPTSSRAFEASPVHFEVRAQQEEGVSRRSMLQAFALAAATAGFSIAPSAVRADDDEAAAPTGKVYGTDFEIKGRDYIEDTRGMLYWMQTTVEAGLDQDKIAKTRKLMNDYASRYRRDEKALARASFSTMSTIVNSLAGHYNNYGPNRPLPKKLKARVQQLFQQAEKAIAREA
eukprot:tig00020675_g12671.t1